MPQRMPKFARIDGNPVRSEQGRKGPNPGIDDLGSIPYTHKLEPPHIRLMRP